MEVSYIQGTVLSQPRLGIGQNFTSKKEFNLCDTRILGLDYTENI